MIKIALTGPESTGKSTLAAQLAQHYHATWVPEYARTYIEQLNRPYQQEDLLAIAQGQLALWKAAETAGPQLLFMDTELLVLKVWSEHAYRQCHPVILEELKRQQFDLYLLLDVDLPWEPDPQREHPHLRQYFFERYRQELQQLGVPFVVISGTAQERFHNAVQAVEQVLAQ